MCSFAQSLASATAWSRSSVTTAPPKRSIADRGELPPPLRELRELAFDLPLHRLGERAAVSEQDRRAIGAVLCLG